MWWWCCYAAVAAADAATLAAAAAATVVIDRMLPVAFLMSFVMFFYAFIGYILYRDAP